MSLRVASKAVILSFTFVFSIVLLLPIVGIAGEDKDKVDVCHITGTHDFGEGAVPIGHLIKISKSAYQVHIKHGDPEVWDDVALPDGSKVCLHEEHLIGSDNDTNWGDPYKQSRPHVPDTLKVVFMVGGDPQPSVTHYYDHDSDKIKRIREVVKSMNYYHDDFDTNSSGVVMLGDLTQKTCCQEVIAFRQMFEDSYPGHDGGSILAVKDTDYTRYSDGFKIKVPVFPGIGNHDDPTEVHETCDWDASCSERADKVCHSTFVKNYIRARIEGSPSLYEASKLLNTDGRNYYRHGDGDIYAWEWGSYHFIHTNMWAGYGGHVSGTGGPSGPTKFSKLNQLKEHLEMNIGDSGKPVLLFQHFGWTHWNFNYNNGNGWWTRDNAADLINVLCRRDDSTEPCNPYNVIGIFSGHVHKTDYSSIAAGNDINGDPVTFDNYLVNDAGPGDDDKSTGYFEVVLTDQDIGSGHMEVYEHLVDINIDGSDWDHDGTVSLYREKAIDLAFVDWEQGEPNNYGGTESCAAVGSKGRFADFDCTEARHLLCRENYGDHEWYITKGTFTWPKAKETCASISATFIAPTTVLEQRKFMNKFKDTGQEHWTWVNARSPWVLKTQLPAAIGKAADDTEGAGIAMADIDGNGTADLIEYHIWDDRNDAATYNYGHYSIGWNPDENGETDNWTGRFNAGAVGGGSTGKNNQGGGITAGYIDDNELIDLVVFFIYNPSGVNKGFYRIGWNINATTGVAAKWDPAIEVPNMVVNQDLDISFLTSRSAGGGVAIGNIGGTSQPDLVFYNISVNPDGINQGKFIIGYDINSTTGEMDNVWRAFEFNSDQAFNYLTSSNNKGGGVSLADIDGNGRHELISYFISDIDGANHAYYRIGWNLYPGNLQIADSWSSTYRANTDVGDITRFAGIAVGDIDNSGRPDMIVASVMGSHPNDFRYAVARNITEEGKIVTQHLNADGILVPEGE
jgi:hypothetical protein